MGFKFRKSINLGGGFRVNLSKSGVGYSWGTKGVRFTKTATGKSRTTLSVPGTGISYVSESAKRNRSTQQVTKSPSNEFPAPEPNDTENGGNNMTWGKFIICLLLGYLGIHKFMEKKVSMGILYLFTCGLFGFGWIYDCIRYFILAIKSSNSVRESNAHQIDSYALTATADPPVEIPANPRFSIKKVFLWVLTVFLGLVALAFLPHIAGIFTLVALALVIPIDKWQDQISCFITSKVKKVIATLMAVLAFFAIPTTEQPEVDRSTPNSTVIETGEVVELATIPPTAEAAVATEPPVVLERISFVAETETIGIGRTVDIPFVLYPENAVCDDLEASIDNAEIASLTFDENGERIVQITGLVPGEVTVTLKAGDTIVATKTIAIAEVLPDGMTIIAPPKAPQIGSTGTFVVEFEPGDVTNQTVTWQSDTPEILQVNKDGSYDALCIGEATITATHENGTVATLLIQVLPVEAESVTLSTDWNKDKSFTKGKTMTLTAEVYPETTTDKSIIWTSSDESVVTVSDKGVVKAIAHGSAVITAKTTNGKTCTYEVRVDPKPQNFKISYSIKLKSNDHVGSSWTKGCEYNGEEIASGTVISIMPGETFTIYGWAEEGDSKPDYGSYGCQMTLTNEMCESGFTIEGEADVRENGGRYSGHYAVWSVKITFKPVD